MYTVICETGRKCHSFVPTEGYLLRNPLLRNLDFEADWCSRCAQRTDSDGAPCDGQEG